MQGLEFDRPVGGIIKAALDHGLILISAGTDVIRFLPPLVAKKEHVDEMLVKLEESIADAGLNG